jgi:hypothetical protein
MFERAETPGPSLSNSGPSLDSFHSLPHQRANALFAGYRASDLWGFDREHIVLYLKKALLISSGPGLIPRNFDFVSDLVAVKTMWHRPP